MEFLVEPCRPRGGSGKHNLLRKRIKRVLQRYVLAETPASCCMKYRQVVSVRQTRWCFSATLAERVAILAGDHLGRATGAVWPGRLGRYAAG